MNAKWIGRLVDLARAAVAVATGNYVQAAAVVVRRLEDETSQRRVSEQIDARRRWSTEDQQNLAAWIAKRPTPNAKDPDKR